MKAVALTFIGLAFVAGIYAANLLKRASAVGSNPGWTCEPGEPDAAIAGWVGAMMQSFDEAARLSGQAAFWTKVTVALGTLGGVLGTFAR
ncbi:MAG: hypothetical protein ACRD5K_00885 [Candidatus Acidiferrales bacterium]